MATKLVVELKKCSDGENSYPQQFNKPFKLLYKSTFTSTNVSILSFQVIFITEYMSSGSLKQFLKKTKKNNKTFPLKVRKIETPEALKIVKKFLIYH